MKLFPLLIPACLAAALLVGCSNKNFSADVGDFLDDYTEQSGDVAQRSYQQAMDLNELLRKAETAEVDAKTKTAIFNAYDPDLPVDERIDSAFKAGVYKSAAEADIADAKRVEIALAKNLLAARAELDKWMGELKDAYDARDAARIKLAKETIVKAQEVITSAVAEWNALQQRKKVEADLATEKKRADELQGFLDQAKAEAAAKEAAHTATPPAVTTGS